MHGQQRLHDPRSRLMQTLSGTPCTPASGEMRLARANRRLIQVADPLHGVRHAPGCRRAARFRRPSRISVSRPSRGAMAGATTAGRPKCGAAPIARAGVSRGRRAAHRRQAPRFSSAACGISNSPASTGQSARSKLAARGRNCGVAPASSRLVAYYPTRRGQAQPPLCPGAGHVQQALRFEDRGVAQLTAQELEQPIALGAHRRSRGHHHAVAPRARELVREQQLIAIGRHGAIERRQHDHVEFQTFGLVNGHDLNRARAAVIGKQIRKNLRQIRRVRHAALFELPDAGESSARQLADPAHSPCRRRRPGSARLFRSSVPHRCHCAHRRRPRASTAGAHSGRGHPR